MNRNIYRYYVSTCIPYGGTEKDGIRCKVVNSDGESSEHTVNCLEFDVIASAYQDIIEESRMRCLIEEYWNEHGFTNFPSMDRMIEHLTGIGLMEYGEGHTKREAIDSLAKKAFFCPLNMSTIRGVPAGGKLFLKGLWNSVRSVFLPSQIRKIYRYISKAPENTLGRYFAESVSEGSIGRITEGIAAYILLDGGYILPCGQQVSRLPKYPK